MGYKVIKDCTEEGKGNGAVGIESVVPNPVIQQYKSISDSQIFKYQEGTIKARLLDADGRVCFHGLLDDVHFSSELFMEWGTCFSGCTTLEIFIDHYAAIFGQPKYPELLSPDGRWYSYID